MMKKKIIILLAIVAIVPVFSLSCKQKEKLSKETVKKKTVLLRIGDIEITKELFKEYYKKSGYRDINLFIKDLILENLVQLEAKNASLEKNKTLYDIKRKVLVRVLLKKDFENWYNPNTISILRVKREYNTHIYKYVAPPLAKVYHILVTIPYWIKNKKILNKRKDEALKIAKELRERLVKENATKLEMFHKVYKIFSKKYNKRIPVLVNWSESLEKRLITVKSRKEFEKVLKESLNVLEKKIPQNCQVCKNAINFLKNKVFEFSINNKLKKEDFIKILDYLKNITHQKLLYQELPPFPENCTLGFPCMEESFSKAAFKTKEKSFSDIVETKYGFHIIFKVSTLPPKNIKFSEVKDELRKKIYKRERFQKFLKWLDSKVKKYNIERYYFNLKSR